MSEDVHQVANYLEIKLKESPDNLLYKEFEWMSKKIVILSIVIQSILVVSLANEVFVKEIQSSGEYLPLRLVLVLFMYFLFNAEQTSITKTNQLISVGKIGCIL